MEEEESQEEEKERIKKNWIPPTSFLLPSDIA